MQITNAMTRTPVSIRSDDVLAKAKGLMESGGFRRLPVVDDGHLVGIITERDLRVHAGHLENTRVNAVMRTALVTIAPEDPVEEAARLMRKRKRAKKPAPSLAEAVRAMKLPGLVEVTAAGIAIQIVCPVEE